jgi:hypothetical protein
MGVRLEPVHGERAGIEDRDVAVVRAEPELWPAAVAHQPVGVRGRHNSILSALHEQHGGVDPLHIEPPWGGERDIVVDLTVGSGGGGPRGVFA